MKIFNFLGVVTMMTSLFVSCKKTEENSVTPTQNTDVQ